MLIAVDSSDRRVIGRDANKREEYVCPECRESVTLKQGRVVIHHFAHRPGAACDNAGETIRHMEMKLCLADGLAPFGAIVEHRVHGGRNRTDVFLSKTEPPVIIECQHSTLSIREMEERQFNYNQIGLLLWVFDASLVFKKYTPFVGFERPASRFSESIRALVEDDGSVTVLHGDRLLRVTFRRFWDTRNDEWGSREVRRFRVVQVSEIARPWTIESRGEPRIATQRPWTPHNLTLWRDTAA